MQFCRLSSDGRSWVCESGHGHIVRGAFGNRNGQIIGEGISPQWLTPETPAWVNGPSVETAEGFLASLDRPLNGLCTNQAGAWAVWSSQAVWDGSQTEDKKKVWLENRSQPAIGPNRDLVTVTADSRLAIDGGLEGSNVRLPRWTAGLAWIQQDAGKLTPYPKVWGWPDEADCHVVIPVLTSSGRWLVVLNDNRLICHPEGQPEGYVIRDVPDTYRPDAVGVGNTIRVVYDNREGLHFLEIDLTQPRVDLRPVVAPVERWVDADPVVPNVWEFIVGEPNARPRTDANGDGRMDRILSQHDGVTSVQFVKWGDVEKDSEGRGLKWERWDLPTGTAYEHGHHAEDHCWEDKPDRGECYQFSDARWFKKRWVVGEAIDCSNNKIRWWRFGAADWTPWAPFPYKMRLLAHEREVNSGRERIRFVYDTGNVEEYTCELGLGWTAWELRNRAGQVQNRTEWRLPLTAPPILPTVGRVPFAAIQPPIVWPPVNPPEPPVSNVKPYPPEIWIVDDIGADLREWAEAHKDDLNVASVTQAAFTASRACARTIQDYQQGMTLEAAIAKHRKDARQELGLGAPTSGPPPVGPDVIPPGSGFADWPADILRIRTNHCAGRFYGISEAPGRHVDLQAVYLNALVEDGYQWCWFSMISGVDSHNDGPAGWPGHWRRLSPYDAVANHDAIRPWVQALLERKIVPIIGFPFQGAPASWDLLIARGYAHNDWCRKHLGAVARHWWDVTSGHCLFALGWELNKKWAGDPDGSNTGGPGERYGFNGLTSYLAKAIKEAVPQAKVFVHLLPDTIGPDGKGDGDRNWTPEGYWKGQGTDDGRQHMDGLFGQYELEGGSDDYFRRQTRTFVSALHAAGKKFYASEFVRPGVDEGRAAHVRQIVMEAGADGFLN